MSETKILEIINNYCYSYGYLNDDNGSVPLHTFVELGLDSLDVIEIVMECEDVFNISITDAELESLDIVQDLINLVDFKTRN